MGYPGKVVWCGKDGECTTCGDQVMPIQDTNSKKRWDSYFHSICEVVASKSPCFSRKIGAILVRDNSIVSTGYNGPARGITHCGHDRFMRDGGLQSKMEDMLKNGGLRRGDINKTCPRKLIGYESGHGMEWCIAEHAESNCVANAARLGVSTNNTTLYMNCVIPCGRCLGTLINAGVAEIVVDLLTNFDAVGMYLSSHDKVRIREFTHV